MGTTVNTKLSESVRLFQCANMMNKMLDEFFE